MFESPFVFLILLVLAAIALAASCDKRPKDRGWIKKESNGVISYTLKKKE